MDRGFTAVLLNWRINAGVVISCRTPSRCSLPPVLPAPSLSALHHAAFFLVRLSANNLGGGGRLLAQAFQHPPSHGNTANLQLALALCAHQWQPYLRRHGVTRCQLGDACCASRVARHLMRRVRVTRDARAHGVTWFIWRRGSGSTHHSLAGGLSGARRCAVAPSAFNRAWFGAFLPSRPCCLWHQRLLWRSHSAIATSGSGSDAAVLST